MGDHRAADVFPSLVQEARVAESRWSWPGLELATSWGDNGRTTSCRVAWASLRDVLTGDNAKTAAALAQVVAHQGDDGRLDRDVGTHRPRGRRG